MFAVGHISLGYLVGNFFARILKVQFNVPLVIVLSIIPDIDIIFELLLGNPVHRGPTHSLIFAFLILPFSEEPWLQKEYGKSYVEYCKKVPRFIKLPFIKAKK